jgi:hypothetical protein
MKDKKSKGQIVSFMGIRPVPGSYWTTNRHDCLGRAQVEIMINSDGTFETLCPTCMGHPTVFFECGQFSFIGETVISSSEEV